MRASGRHQRQVTHLNGYATFPDFSPDGGQLVFTLVSEDGATDLWTVGVDGHDPRPLTTTPGLAENNAAWSSDGRRLLVLRAALSVPTTCRFGSEISGADGNANSPPTTNRRISSRTRLPMVGISPTPLGSVTPDDI